MFNFNELFIDNNQIICFFFSKLYGIEINIAQKQFTNLEKIIVVLMYTFRLHFKNL